MIISHKHRFIFVKTRKTGGTSVEIALAPACGPNDVLTPITPIDELLRLDAGAACRNYSSDPAMEAAYLASLREQRGEHRLPPELRARQTYRNHMSLDELEKIDPGLTDAYRIISVERHPYEKAVSLANFQLGASQYKQGRGLDASLADIAKKIDLMIESGSLRSKVCNWDLYTVAGEMRVDHMLRYESLSRDFTAVVTTLGLSEARQLPKTKVGRRDRSVAARDILSADQRAAVQAACTDEFDHFDYER